jgi:N-acetylmuramoyl-L-alanine amidase
MKPEHAHIFAALSHEQAMGLTIYAESRGEPAEGQAGVGYVIKNRADNPGWWGRDIRAVCFKPYQFSCYNDTDRNYARLVMIADDFEASLRMSPVLRECCLIAKGVIEGTVENPVDGATHYLNPRLCDPAWERRMEFIVEIGHHRFYREK